VTDFNAEVGKAIKNSRDKRKIGRQELSDACGIGINTLYNIESGKRKVSLQNTVRIAEELGVPVTELLEGVYSPPAIENVGYDTLNKDFEELCKALAMSSAGELTGVQQMRSKVLVSNLLKALLRNGCSVDPKVLATLK